jgi:hypothetical protein
MHALPRHEQLVGELQQLGISAVATDMWSIKKGTYMLAIALAAWCQTVCKSWLGKREHARPVRKPGSAWGTWFWDRFLPVCNRLPAQ